MSIYKMCAYWGQRQETVDACSIRLSRFLIALSACDSVFATWYEQGVSATKARQSRIEIGNTKYLAELLNRGRHRRDTDHGVIEELGFHVGIWNGMKSNRMAGMSITCGLYSTAPGLGGNSVVISLPEELGELEQSARMENVLEAAVRAWEPEWAGVMSLESMNKRRFNPAVPFVDWMLFVCHPISSVAELPQGASARQLDNRGSLIVVSDKPPDADNPAHLERVRDVADVLRLV